MSIIIAVLINVILVQGSYGVTTQEWETIKQETKAIYARELRGRNVPLRFSTPIYEESGITYTLSNKEEAYYSWRDRLRKEGKKGIWLVVLPPVEDNGLRYIAGYARTTCFKDLNLAVVVVFLQSKNSYGDNRLLHSSYAITHELGHAMGAKHVDSMTIMHPNPLPWVTQYGALPFDIKSKREMRRCVG